MSAQFEDRQWTESPRHLAARAEQDRRFWSKVDKSAGPEACWPWRGPRSRFNHGVIWYDLKNRKAHRVAYQLANGKIPSGMVVRHACDVPECCNPAHLLVGTLADNVRDRVERGRCARADRSGMNTKPESRSRGLRNGAHTQPWTRRRGALNGRAKLSQQEAFAVRFLSRSRLMTMVQIALDYDVSPALVRFIRNGRVWASLEAP